MELSLSSFFSSSISISVLVGILYLVLKKKDIMSKLGLNCIFLLVMLILIRAFIPLEFSITKSFYSLNLSYIRDTLVAPCFTVGSLKISIFSMMYFIWFFVFAIRLVLLGRNYRNWTQTMKTFSEVTDASVLESLQKAVADIYPEKEPAFFLVSSNILSSPAISGIFRPTIILPDIPYTKDELYHVFYHEIMHYKHKDFLLKLCVEIVIAFHWWNLIITKLLMGCVNQIQELLIDSYTTRHLTKNQKADYMFAITKTLKYATIPASSSTKALVDSHNDSAIYNRLQYIINNPVKKNSIVGTILFLVLFIFSFTFVFEAESQPEIDETGIEVWRATKEETYYIKNGDSYDLYMQNEYVITMDEIMDEFKDIPIYEKGE